MYLQMHTKKKRMGQWTEVKKIYIGDVSCVFGQNLVHTKCVRIELQNCELLSVFVFELFLHLVCDFKSRQTEFDVTFITCSFVLLFGFVFLVDLLKFQKFVKYLIIKKWKLSSKRNCNGIFCSLLRDFMIYFLFRALLVIKILKNCILILLKVLTMFSECCKLSLKLFSQHHPL